MARSPRKPKSAAMPQLSWPDATELVGLTLELRPQTEMVVAPQYTTELHSWFLDQVRRMDFELSQQLHDGQSEKPFTIANLTGDLKPHGRSLLLSQNQPYHWTITLLSRPVVAWTQQWLQSAPTTLHLRSGSFDIVNWQLDPPPTTYAQLLPSAVDAPTLTLSFITPTSFRRKGHHFPLPVPANVFHSYLRRWNDFSGEHIDQADFLDWVEEGTVILRHHLESAKVAAGKSGAVTGFTGSIQFGLTRNAQHDVEYVQLWLALGRLAPYCGTGHKTTFGLGQTRWGWLAEPQPSTASPLQTILAQRIDELTQHFIAQRKRTGGDRATQVAQTWATILARRELGESLAAIAQDLEMPYETVKSYVKLARKALSR